MLGELFPPYSTTGTLSSITMEGEDISADVAAGRNCLIVWDDPWDISSWEVTPGYLKKWGWLLEGCEELILSTNRWRASRYEEPLEFAI